MRTARMGRLIGGSGWTGCRLMAGVALVALVAAACATEEPPNDEPSGPTITVASFNFSESVLLAEIYAQALEDQDYPVDKRLDLGSREVIFPAIESGELDLLPEYVGSALSVGFESETTPTDADEARAELQTSFSELGVTVLQYAPGQNTNVFVVTSEFAESNELTSIGDLSEVDEVVLGAPPECEERDTCLIGLRETYGLENVTFEVMPEQSTRVAALNSGDIDLALLFSTDPVILQEEWVPLTDDQGMIPVENIVPVINDEIIDAYGSDLTEVINGVTARITTAVLLELNGRVQLEQDDPEDVARDWLIDEGIIAA